MLSSQTAGQTESVWNREENKTCVYTDEPSSRFMLATPYIKVHSWCLPWWDSHQWAVYPSLGKQHWGCTTKHLQFSSLDLVVVYVFTFPSLGDVLLFVLYEESYISEICLLRLVLLFVTKKKEKHWQPPSPTQIAVLMSWFEIQSKTTPFPTLHLHLVVTTQKAFHNKRSQK